MLNQQVRPKLQVTVTGNMIMKIICSVLVEFTFNGRKSVKSYRRQGKAVIKLRVHWKSQFNKHRLKTEDKAAAAEDQCLLIMEAPPLTLLGDTLPWNSVYKIFLPIWAYLLIQQTLYMTIFLSFFPVFVASSAVATSEFPCCGISNNTFFPWSVFKCIDLHDNNLIKPILILVCSHKQTNR